MSDAPTGPKARPLRYIDLLPEIYRRADAAGSPEFLDRYLQVFESFLGRVPLSAPVIGKGTPPVTRAGLADILDVLPDLFYPRLSFLFPDDDGDEIPPLAEKAVPGGSPTYTTDAASRLALLNDYFGITDPSTNAAWTSDVAAWLRGLLAWQCQWLGLAGDESWSLDKWRSTLASILPIWRRRGTLQGLQALLDLFVGGWVVVRDAVSAPPLSVGVNSTLKTAFDPGDPVLGGVRPFAFEIELSVPTYDLSSADVRRRIDAIKSLVDREKPVQTTYSVVTKTVTACVGVRSTPGVDFLIPKN